MQLGSLFTVPRISISQRKDRAHTCGGLHDVGFLAAWCSPAQHVSHTELHYRIAPLVFHSRIEGTRAIVPCKLQPKALLSTPQG